MKVVILAGGLGTRLSEETQIKPKPMVEIGGMPILWHIMKIYSHYGFNEFVICCGYKGYVIKEYFANYFIHNSDVTIDLGDNSIEFHKKRSEPWKVTLVDTGLETMTGGRLKRVGKYLTDDNFCLTYGDGIANINIKKLVDFHYAHGKMATVTAVQPPGRFGALKINNETVTSFEEKPSGDGMLINGGFFVFSTGVLDFIDSDDCILEQSPLINLAKNNDLKAFKHNDFWHPMDTLRDRNYLDALWEKSSAPWKIWEG